MVGLYHKTVLAKYCDEYKNMKPCFENQIATREDIDNAAAELDKLRSELADMQGEYESAISEKKAVTAHYTTFIRQMETDYERCLRSGKKELEEYEANLSKPEPPKPSPDENKKIEQEKREAERQISIEEERSRTEERRKRNYYSR